MTDEHRPEKPPEHRPENNQQPGQSEHRPDNNYDPSLAEMYKDSQYVLEDADSLRLDPDPAAPTPPIPDPGPRIAFEQADSDPQWGSPDPSGPIQEEGSDPFEFRPNPTQLGNHPDPFEFRSNPNQLGVEGEGSPTEEADGSWSYGEVSRTDTSDAHQPGGFHPSYPSPWPYGEVSPTEEAKDSGWPYGETNPTGQASFLERSDAVRGQGGLVDPYLTEDPSTAAHQDVQEQEDFFEGV